MAEAVEQEEGTEEEPSELVKWARTQRSGSKFSYAKLDKTIGYEGKR